MVQMVDPKNHHFNNLMTIYYNMFQFNVRIRSPSPSFPLRLLVIPLEFVQILELFTPVLDVAHQVPSCLLLGLSCPFHIRVLGKYGCLIIAGQVDHAGKLCINGQVDIEILFESIVEFDCGSGNVGPWSQVILSVKSPSSGLKTLVVLFHDPFFNPFKFQH